MIEKLIKKFYTPYREMWTYLLFGGLTTVINYVIYEFLIDAFGVDELISNCVAWIFSVTFAYVTNKLVVFRSKEHDKDTILRESISFFAFRLLSLGIESLVLYICVTRFNLMDILFGKGFLSDNNFRIIKLLTNVLVVVINYVASKLVIFRKKEKQ